MLRQTYNSQLWEDEEKFLELSKWVSGKGGEKTFSCKLCDSKPLQLGNMGVKALKTHQKTSGHIKKVEASKNQMSLAKSFASTCSTVIQCSNTASEKDKNSYGFAGCIVPRFFKNDRNVRADVRSFFFLIVIYRINCSKNRQR